VWGGAVGDGQWSAVQVALHLAGGQQNVHVAGCVWMGINASVVGPHLSGSIVPYKVTAWWLWDKSVPRGLLAGKSLWEVSGGECMFWDVHLSRLPFFQSCAFQLRSHNVMCASFDCQLQWSQGVLQDEEAFISTPWWYLPLGGPWPASVVSLAQLESSLQFLPAECQAACEKH
jgi:hypothetical protein